MRESEIRDQVRAYIVENFLYTRRDFVFGDEDSLLRNGVFDSLGVMELIGFLEKAWGISVPPDDIVEDNFGTVGRIVRYVSQRAVEAA